MILKDGRKTADKTAHHKKAAKAISLTDRAYSILRHEIITCVLRPGTEMSEQDLAARLQMSKTPVPRGAGPADPGRAGRVLSPARLPRRSSNREGRE